MRKLLEDSNAKTTESGGVAMGNIFLKPLVFEKFLESSALYDKELFASLDMELNKEDIRIYNRLSCQGDMPPFWKRLFF